MKKFINFWAVMLAVVLISPVFTSCSDDEEDGPKDPSTPTVTLDKAALDAEIAACEALVNAASTDDYPETAITTFKTLIASIKTAEAAATTQSAIDNLLTQLQAGKTTFLAAAYGAIADNALIAKWTFDTEDENQISEGNYQWTAVCKESPSVFETKSVPTFVAGVSGKAVNLENGAHLEVADFSESAILPTDFSISVWVKLSKTYANNYIVSYNYWNTWKLQVQDLNKPFFTFASNEGIADADNETDQSVKEGEWTMITTVLSYTDHTLNFYINGELTKAWDATAKPALAGTSWATYTSTVGALPIFIGLSTSEAEAAAAWDWEWSAESLGAFYGAIDNLAFYNIALTDGQVKKLYKDEK